MSALMISQASFHCPDTARAHSVCYTGQKKNQQKAPFLLPDNSSAIGFVGTDFLSCLSNSHTVQGSSSLQGIFWEKKKAIHYALKKKVNQMLRPRSSLFI